MMADDDSMGLGPTDAPVNRDQKPDPDVIDGVAVHEEATRPAEAMEPQPSAPAPARQPGRFGALVAGAVGGAIVAALAIGAYSTLAPRPGLSDEDSSRIAAAESGVQKQSVAVDAVEKQLATLESTSAALAPKVAAAAESADQASAAIRKLSDIPATGPVDAGLAQRIEKLESAPVPAPADVSGLSARIDKLEQALQAEKTAPKAETRVAPDAGDHASAVAIVAEALRDKLTSGSAFPQELGALQSLGVDVATLAPLKAVVDGAPTGATLAASFSELAPTVLAATHKSQGNIGDRFLDHLRGLVVIHDLGETSGDDPDALVTQVEAMSRRSDFSGALAAFGKLPESARKVAAAWSTQAGQAAAAMQAVRAIREEAIGRLAAGGKS